MAIQQLARLEDGLHNLFAGYGFNKEAVLANTEPDDWQVGFALHQHHLQQQGQLLIQQLQQTRLRLK